uniref:TFIIS central domain-containing protein n=1 Tax=Globisporangium ultimum (strain ATCC 200006 / CBS 805.95 / DAOM BR144) TaxID=431595 RepID=K3WLH9_GLOUD
MLSNVLELSGPGHLKLAKEIEEFVFDRYKESNDDYMVQARMITFGLKGNKNLRDRLFSGSLHGLELVYADDKPI